MVTYGGVKLVHIRIQDPAGFMERITLAALALAFVSLAEFPWGQEDPGLVGLHQDAASGMQCGRWDLCSMQWLQSHYKRIFTHTSLGPLKGDAGR